MKTYIVLIPLTNNNDARKQCETIENHKFDNPNFPCDTVNASKIKDMVIKLIDDDTYDLSGIEVEPITDFMELCNDELFDADSYFISYVYA